jgi:glyoxylase-like metal-dependent hydrolase (beta-lactamase superfamily II)
MNAEPQVINLGFVNTFLLPAGDGYVLIDTGMDPQWEQLESQLLKSGCLPDKLKLVVITHGDMDHTGNCAKLQKKYHAKIAMHPGDRAMAETGARLVRKTRSFKVKIFMSLHRLTRGKTTFETFTPDLLPADGQDLKEYGLAARILHTPGHTPGSIAVLTDQGWLFPGDTISNSNKPDIGPFIQDDQELRDSLAKLKGLSARTIYPGHGKPFPFTALAGIEV